MQETIQRIEEQELKPFRVRVMRLMTADYQMGFHLDTLDRKQTWRLHIPIFTNIESLFQWKTDDEKIVQMHLPADGSAYLVRVDLLHRAVNNAAHPTETGRVHMLCGIDRVPQLDRVDFDIIAETYPGDTKGQKVFILSRTIVCEQANKPSIAYRFKTGS